jgi:hypothetical protein
MKRAIVQSRLKNVRHRSSPETHRTKFDATAMPLNCNFRNLVRWAEQAQLEDITYHRTRQQLWDKFTRVIKAGGRHSIDRTLFNSIKSVLTARSDALDDNKRLAFDTALEQIVAEGEDGDRGDVGDDEKKRGARGGDSGSDEDGDDDDARPATKKRTLAEIAESAKQAQPKSES